MIVFHHLVKTMGRVMIDLGGLFANAKNRIWVCLSDLTISCKVFIFLFGKMYCLFVLCVHYVLKRFYRDRSGIVDQLYTKEKKSIMIFKSHPLRSHTCAKDRVKTSEL